MSIDVGTTHLGYVLATACDWDRFAILDWACIHLDERSEEEKKKQAQLPKSRRKRKKTPLWTKIDPLIKEMDLRLVEAERQKVTVDMILLEQQLDENPVMFAVCHALFLFFRMRLPGVQIKIVSSNLKMKLCEQKFGLHQSQSAFRHIKKRTARNKAVSKAGCLMALRTTRERGVATEGNSVSNKKKRRAWIKFFVDFVLKQDDLADSLMQLLAVWCYLVHKQKSIVWDPHEKCFAYDTTTVTDHDDHRQGGGGRRQQKRKRGQKRRVESFYPN